MRAGRVLLPTVLAAMIAVGAGACGADDDEARSAVTPPGTPQSGPAGVEPAASTADPTPSTAAVEPSSTEAAKPPSTEVATSSATTDRADVDDAMRPEGFERVQATVTLRDGTRCELCLWLADDADRRSRGLMHVTDLGAADGMAFRWEMPTTAQFWMGNTPMPLSIAFFAADGSFVSSVDMEPCLTGGDDCPRYRADDEYLIAIELPRGEVANLDIGAGSVLTLADLPCA